MKTLFLTLFSLGLVSSLWAAPELIIENHRKVNIRTEELRTLFFEAHEIFARELGPVNRTFVISIAPNSCLRTGYNFMENKVVFCPTEQVENLGLNSIDVINHELFHAFLCNYAPAVCGKNMRVDVHEGLADYFAYIMNPDQNFGENFYIGYPYIRTYVSSWRPGLVQGDHERGNAFASQFIRNRVPLLHALNTFRMNFVEEESDIVKGVPASPLNRYRLGRGEAMEIEFHFAPTARVSKVVWSVPRGLRVDQLGTKSFKIQLIEEITVKAFAIFLAPDGSELGRKTYYFGKKI